MGYGYAEPVTYCEMLACRVIEAPDWCTIAIPTWEV
jgi:hypothetical protein